VGKPPVEYSWVAVGIKAAGLVLESAYALTGFVARRLRSTAPEDGIWEQGKVEL
jgi:hypothetical protein